MTSQAVDALQKIHVEVEKVINGMDQSDWQLQSLCEGWRVQEVFAHMSSNMKEAINPTPPPDTPQEPMKAEEANLNHEADEWAISKALVLERMKERASRASR